MTLFAYETLEERNAVLNMSADLRLVRLMELLHEGDDEWDRLAMQALHMEMSIVAFGERCQRRHYANGAVQCILSAAKAREAFHIITWNVKHYPFVKEHHEACIGFGTILRDGAPYELSGSMCCPGDHIDLNEEQARTRATKLIEEAGAVLTAHGL